MADQVSNDLQNTVNGIKSGIDNTAAAAGRWAGRAIGAALGGVGGIVGGKVGDWVGRHARQVVEGVTAFFVAELLISFAITMIAAVITLVFGAFVMFIINNSAYVVPLGHGVSGTNGLETSNQRVGCFVFSGLWSPTDLQKENIAATTIMSFTGYSDALCRDGDITVEYNSNDPGYGGITYGSARRIIIYYQGVTAYSPASTTYTLAHESGHVYDAWNAGTGPFVRDPGVVSELPLVQNGTYMEGICTYPSSQDRLPDMPGLQIPPYENFAEAIALTIVGSNAVSGYRNIACMGGSFSSAYPATSQYIQNAVF